MPKPKPLSKEMIVAAQAKTKSNMASCKVFACFLSTL